MNKINSSLLSNRAKIDSQPDLKGNHRVTITLNDKIITETTAAKGCNAELKAFKDFLVYFGVDYEDLETNVVKTSKFSEKFKVFRATNIS